MKRDGGPPQRLAVHEVGHVAVGYAQELITVTDSRWSTQGFTFTAVSSESDWSDYDRKVRTIGAQVAVALGGGAAEIAVLGGPDGRDVVELTFDDVLAAAGTIDVQLAQEWLALQRHDPSQDSIETEIVEVFRTLVGELATEANRAVLRSMAEHFLGARGELREDVVVPFAGSALLGRCAGLRLSSSCPLRHTIVPNVVAETTTR